MFKVGDKVKMRDILKNMSWYTSEILTIIKIINDIVYVNRIFSYSNSLHKGSLEKISIRDFRKLKLEKITNMKTFKGIKVAISEKTEYPTPYGYEYSAKGCYVNKKFLIVVGHLEKDNTIRLKYPMKDIINIENIE